MENLLSLMLGTDGLIMIYVMLAATIVVAWWGEKLGRSLYWSVVGSLSFTPIVVAIYYILVGPVKKCKCGAKIVKGSFFCGKCGAQLH